MAEARSAEGQNPKQERSAGPADGAKNTAPASSGRRRPRSGAVPDLLAHVKHCGAVKINERRGAIVKPVTRYRSQLLRRKSYKPTCVIRIRPSAKLNFVFRPVNRFGAKPQLITVP